MEKKTKILSAVVVVAVLVISGVLFFVVFQEKNSDPLSNLGYSNREEGFGFNPPAGWKLSGEMAGVVYFNYTINGNTSENLGLTVYNHAGASYKQNLSYYVNQTLIELANSTLENNSLISHNERTVNGMNAYEFVFTHDYHINQTKYEVKIKYVYVEKNGRLFGIEYSGRPDLYDEYEPIAEQSINTLVII